MNALIAGRDELLRGLLVPAPASYKGRLIAQTVLAGLLVIQCTLYLAIWVRDARRAGKSLNIFQIKKTKGGPLITIQALCAYILSNLLCAIAIIADRVQIYRMYFHHIPMRYDAVADTLSISFASLGCLAYTFSNFHCALLLTRGSKTLESTGLVWLITYNVCFGVAALAWIIGATILTARLVPAFNALYKTSMQLLELLENLIADPSLLSPDAIAQMTSYQSTLMAAGAVAAKESRSMSILGQTYCGFYAVASIGSLAFVFGLRKHARSTRSILMPADAIDSGLAAHDQGQKFSDPVGTATDSDISAHRATLSSTSTTRRKSFASRRNATALERLAADLALSVPLVLLFCIYLIVVGIYGEHTRFETGWSWTEFRNDCFTWAELLIANPIVGYFLYNTWTAPGRYGATNDPTVGSGSDSARALSSRNTHQLSFTHSTVTKELELPGSADDLDDAHVTEDLPDREKELKAEKGSQWV